MHIKCLDWSLDSEVAEQKKLSMLSFSYIVTSDIFKSKDPQTFNHDYKKTALY